MTQGASPKPALDTVDRIDRGVARVEAGMLVLVLSVMLGLSILQLVLRKFFDFGFEWADIIVRQMVLWLGFIGGALATHKGRHIAIDAAARFLPPQKAAAVRTLTSTIAAGLCCVLTWAGWVFVRDEMESGSHVFAEVPSWPFQAIIPLAFAAISFHFLVAARASLLVALGKRRPGPSEYEEIGSEEDIDK